jgi:hypothetical protein
MPAAGVVTTRALQRESTAGNRLFNFEQQRCLDSVGHDW